MVDILLTGSWLRRSLQNVTIHPVALFSILDHYLRRTDTQERVIGTLVGTRTETEIEVHNSFAVLHSETSEQVAVDMEYHRTVYELHHKVHPKEVIIGWCAFHNSMLRIEGCILMWQLLVCRYSTGSNLNTYSALIQNFYSAETGAHPAVHVALNTGTEEGSEPGVKAFLRFDSVTFDACPCINYYVAHLWASIPSLKIASSFLFRANSALTMPNVVAVRFCVSGGLIID